MISHRIRRAITGRSMSILCLLRGHDDDIVCRLSACSVQFDKKKQAKYN